MAEYREDARFNILQSYATGGSKWLPRKGFFRPSRHASPVHSEPLDSSRLSCRIRGESFLIEKKDLAALFLRALSELQLLPQAPSARGVRVSLCKDQKIVLFIPHRVQILKVLADICFDPPSSKQARTTPLTPNCMVCPCAGVTVTSFGPEKGTPIRPTRHHRVDLYVKTVPPTSQFSVWSSKRRLPTMGWVRKKSN